MKVIPFKHNHIQQAKKLAELNFAEENKRLNNILPTESIPDLSVFAKNNMGVVAYDGDVMLGFMGCYGPINNLFGKSNGIWSPVHAHGTVEKNRKKIYSLMYQHVAKIWVDQGLLSHCITLYANDNNAINCFFDNGFGKRLVDAVMDVNSFPCKFEDDNLCFELNRDQFSKVHSLSNLTTKHLQNSPSFMPRKEESLQSFMQDITDDIRIFTAQIDGKIVAYLKIQNEGETFISENKNMMNVTGAYVIDEYRGSGISSKLLNYVVSTLKNKNITHLGVDYESLNPTANSFWQKHFVPYTYGLTRRIDERIIE